MFLLCSSCKPTFRLHLLANVNVPPTTPLLLKKPEIKSPLLPSALPLVIRRRAFSMLNDTFTGEEQRETGSSYVYERKAHVVDKWPECNWNNFQFKKKNMSVFVWIRLTANLLTATGGQCLAYVPVDCILDGNFKMERWLSVFFQIKMTILKLLYLWL